MIWPGKYWPRPTKNRAAIFARIVEKNCEFKEIQMLRTLGFLALVLLADSAAGEMTVLNCARLIDTATGEIRENQQIIVENDRVRDIGPWRPSRQGSDTIALDTCLPGLMDMHVHLRHENTRDHYIKQFVRNEADSALRAAYFARITLDAGFTTVRDLGDGSFETVALRNAINEGYAVGPRIFAVGKSVATTGGHADPTNGYRRNLMGDPGPAEGVINSPDEAREAVRYRYKVGADAIKITATGGVLSLAKSGQNPQFTQEELNALVETASEYGMHVAAHAHGTEGMRRAVLAGVRSIEHGTFMDESVMSLMIDKDTFWVPTLLAGKFVGEKAQEEGYFPDVVRPKAAAIGPKINETFEQAYKAGVKIAFGTDSGVSPHGDNAQEFELMVKLGMAPMEAIQAATITAAELLEASHELGRIAPGYYADIVALDGNPLDDISLLQDIGFVMKGGVVYKY